MDDQDIRVTNRSLEQDHEQDNLDNGTESRLQNNGDGLLRDLAGQLLASETQQVGCGQHGNVVGDEDGKMPFGLCKVLHSLARSSSYFPSWTYKSDGHWHNRPQHVGDHGQCAGTPSANDEELDGVEASPATLSIRMQTLSHCMPIVVVLRERRPAVALGCLFGCVLARGAGVVS